MLTALLLLLTPVAHADGVPTLGGFGYVLQGVEFTSVVGLGGPLEHALGEGSAPGLAAWQFGGGGKVLAWNFLVGGKGYGLIRPETSTAVGSARFGGGGGGLELGYAAVNRDGWLVYPYAGVSGLALNMELDNEVEVPIEFGDFEIGAELSEGFSSSYVVAEYGLGFQRLLHDGGGGWHLGAEMGLMLTVDSAPWEAESGGEVGDTISPEVSGVYFRTTMGGGGFVVR